MDHADSTSGEIPVIAVIGGGASGTLAAIHLLREAGASRLPLRVALIDQHGRHGRGQAYSTTHPSHLLNSPADTMSALGDDPGHLVRWAERRHVRHDGFLPRGTYGDYLCEALTNVQRAAMPWARVTRLTSRVVAVRPDCGRRALRLDLAAEGRIDADVVILATGNLPPAPAFPVDSGPRFVADPWEPAAFNGTADGSLVVIAGSGPTMVDVAISLAGLHPRTRVLAVSRHGLLPRAHDWPRPAPDYARMPDFGGAAPVRLTRLIRDIRTSASGQNGHWQDVIDALRPQVPELWRRLPDLDKRTFLRHVARYWEVHRHRMPPATAQQVGLLQASGRLTLLSGRIASARTSEEGIRVSIDVGESRAEVHAGWLINCSGPTSDISSTADVLLQNLFASGLARPDSLGLGLAADWSGLVHGPSAGNIYALGPLMRGLRYETTAIPEIREQAAGIASLLVGRLARVNPRSAA
jgi:uncharacterized NAD(P)/FAD-binding protein YdhS